MILEIGYTYQEDKTSPVHESWTYFYVKADDFEVAKKKATTYFKKFVSELGWTKRAKIKHIQKIRHATETPASVIVDSRELPPARQRRSPLKSSSPSSRKKPSRTRAKPSPKKP